MPIPLRTTPRSKARAALPFLAALLCCSAAHAQRSPSPAPSHGQWKLAQGEALELRALGADYAPLQSLRVVGFQGGKAVPARGLLAHLGRSERGGRRLEIRATAEAAPGLYRVEGWVGAQARLVLPLALEVAEAPRAAAAPRGSPPGAVRGAPSAARARPARSFTSVARRQLESNVPLGAAAQVGGSGLKSVPGMEHRGPGMPASSTLVVSVSPDTQVSHLVPEGQGVAGALLEINGQALPHQSCQVRLGAQALPIVSATAAKISARLPAAPTSGALVLVRTSDGATAILADPYPVVAASTPKAFEHFGGSGADAIWTDAYLLSLLSWIAYAPDAVVESQASAFGLTLSKPLIHETTWFFADPGTLGASGSTTALVLYDAEHVFVAFRGSTTQDWGQDWIDNDLDLAPLPYLPWGAGVVLHHGFHEAMAIAYDEVRARVAPLCAGRKLWITGHSLGGAIALLTAFRLKKEDGLAVQGVHVFGAPAVGNPKVLNHGWAKVFPEQVSNAQRWNLENDPVPCLLAPPAFGHVGACNNLGADGGVQLASSTAYSYVPSTSTLDHLLVTHMDYWHRLRIELEERDPARAAQLPLPPPGSGW